MDIRHLDLLRELAARGSVTAVARATYRTPSAVSQQLKAAQRELGVPLVEPAGRGLRLTEAGRLLAEGGATVATALAQVQARWDAYRSEPSGTVSVAALPSAATFLLPDAVRRLATTAISLRCRDIDLAEAEFARLAADDDVVVGHSLTGPRPAGADGLVVVPLAREPLDVAMADDHPLARRPQLTPDDVAGEDWIGVPPGYPFDTVLLSLARAVGRDLVVTQRLRDNRLVEALVASSRHLAILPRFTTPAGAGVTLRPLTGVPATRHVTALLRPDRAERLSVRHVLEVLRSVGAEVEHRHRRDVSAPAR
jgi:DNA-binding transcriptional LysR family regulator